MKKNRKIKQISLGTLSAVVAVAVPVATVISCGNKEDGLKHVSATINMDNAFKNARKFSTEINLNKNLVTKDATGQKHFDTKSPDYIDPTAYVASKMIDDLLNSLSKEFETLKPIIKKLEANNNMYLITKDLIDVVFDGPLLTNSGHHFSVRKLEQQMHGGLLSVLMMISGDEEKASDFMGRVLTLIWDSTKKHVAQTNITTGEFVDALNEMNNSSIKISIINNGKKTVMTEGIELVVPDQALEILDGYDSKKPLADTITELLPIVKAMIPTLMEPKMKKASLGSMFSELLNSGIPTSGKTKSGKPKPPLTTRLTMDPKLKSFINILSISYQKLLNGEFGVLKNKLTNAGIEDFLKELGLSKDLTSKAKLMFSMIQKLVSLYE